MQKIQKMLQDFISIMDILHQFDYLKIKKVNKKKKFRYVFQKVKIFDKFGDYFIKLKMNIYIIRQRLYGENKILITF